MKKTFGELVDGLITADLKLWHLVEKAERGEATGEDFTRTQVINRQRTTYMNELSKFFPDQDPILKV